MTALFIAEESRRQLDALVTDPPQAMVLIGPRGIGKYTVAFDFATKITTAEHISVVTPDDKGTIAIELIRDLYRLTRSRQTHRQVVIIDHAEAMGIEAQNAFLKLLEEPRAGVTFILTAPTEDILLPTITSRVQSVALQRVHQKQLQTLALQLSAGLEQQEMAQLLFVADGRPAIVAHLLSDPAAFAHHKELMQQAKKLITAGAYERLSSIATIAKTRDDAIQVLEAMAHMVHIQLLRSPNDNLMRLADAIQLTLARLAQNGNPRAQLTALFAR
jgi:replication-associated recombination protein RarA